MVVWYVYVSPHYRGLERLGIVWFHQLLYFLPQNTRSQYTDYVLHLLTSSPYFTL